MSTQTLAKWLITGICHRDCHCHWHIELWSLFSVWNFGCSLIAWDNQNMRQTTWNSAVWLKIYSQKHFHHDLKYDFIKRDTLSDCIYWYKFQISTLSPQVRFREINDWKSLVFIDEVIPASQMIGNNTLWIQTQLHLTHVDIKEYCFYNRPLSMGTVTNITLVRILLTINFQL